MPPQLTIVVSTGAQGELVLTTWGIRQGRYASLGRVTMKAEGALPVDSLDELAVTVLTALYGLDYDL